MIDHNDRDFGPKPVADHGPAPAVSIGLPVHNGERYIRQAVESVLAQTWSDWELIISDNGSTDATEAICTAYAAGDSRIRYYRYETNFGAAWNYNHVLSQACGPYFKWLAHDDVILPNYLAKCLETFAKAPLDVVLVFPSRQWMEPDGRVLGTPPIASQVGTPGDYHDLTLGRLLRLAGAEFPMLIFGLIRRETLLRTRGIGNFNAADLALSLELRLLGRFWQIAEPLYYQRLHDATPAQRHRETAQGEAQWYDPFRTRKLNCPLLRLMGEMALAVLYSDQSIGHKCGLLGGIPVGRLIAALQKPIDTVASVCWATWAKGSLRAVRSSGFDQLQGRVWCLLAGLRRREGSLIGLAFSRPWWRANLQVLRFVAHRLACRIEPDALRILLDWWQSECPIRRQAAVEVMRAYPRRFATLGVELPEASSCSQTPSAMTYSA